MADPLVTCLSYSAGVQSHGIVEMILAGLLPIPKRFAAIQADPGMESVVSYRFVDETERRFAERGLKFIRASGPNLFRDVTDLSNTSKTRLDTPPFWTKNPNGTSGQIKQKCTSHYKIGPIKRAVRKELFRLFGIPVKRNLGLSPGCVEQWIGFTKDEQHRADNLVKSVKSNHYVRFRFPLIELGYTKSDLIAVYLEHGWKIPVRSMCNGCPFHGLRSLKEMHDDRPEDWAQAVAIDNACRNLTQIGINNPCYVSRTLIPLVELAEKGFELDDVIENDLQQCQSGACFM